jgi:hypothetical protein
MLSSLMQSMKVMVNVRIAAENICFPCLKYLGEHEAFTMLYNHAFLFSPRQADQLLWCCFINTTGRRGKHTAMDLHMEHLNRVCKDALCGLGANKTPKAI